MLSWWYGAGWRQRTVMIRERIAATADFFSIDLLLRTFFSPFRQISAGEVDGPIGVKVRAFFDRLISRVIGSIVRSIIIVIGVVVITFHGLVGFLVIVSWAFVPLLPVIGLGLYMTGWTLSWM